jgi:hypothetical protein
MATQRLLEGCSPERLAVSDGGLIERIRAAALKRSGGSLSELEDALRLAGQDWRDLLMAVGFGEKLNAHDVWLNSSTARIP